MAAVAVGSGGEGAVAGDTPAPVHGQQVVAGQAGDGARPVLDRPVDPVGEPGQRRTELTELLLRLGVKDGVAAGGVPADERDRRRGGGGTTAVASGSAQTLNSAVDEMLPTASAEPAMQ